MSNVGRKNYGALANITKDALEPVWMRYEIPTRVIADSLGVSRRSVQLKAQSFGLPKRHSGMKPRLRSLLSDDLLTRMWNAGVSTAEIAEFAGYSRRTAVAQRVRRLGLKPRKRLPGSSGGWPTPVSIREFQEIELRRLMAKSPPPKFSGVNKGGRPKARMTNCKLYASPVLGYQNTP